MKSPIKNPATDPTLRALRCSRLLRGTERDLANAERCKSLGHDSFVGEPIDEALASLRETAASYRRIIAECEGAL